MTRFESSVFGGAALLLVAVACGESDGGDPGGAGGTAGSGGVAGATGGAAGNGPLGIALPQAIDGALLANPSVYSQVPLRIATTGSPQAVKVELAGEQLTAADPDGDGEFLAMLPLGSLGEGTQKLTARAVRAGEPDALAEAQLLLSNTGVQLTDFAKVGMSATPRLHHVAGALYLTWRDRSETSAGVYLRRMDGAAAFTEPRVTLIPPGENALYARAAFGSKKIGILYQTLGNPYVNHFKVVDTTGAEVLAPVALDPSGSFGNSGGDIAFDGSGWVFVWRSTDGTTQELRWARVAEEGGTLTGPVVVATSGNDDPHGKFPGFVPVGVRALGDKSLVSFVRERWDSLLAMAIPKSQLASVSGAGQVLTSDYAGKESDWTFHHEARVFNVGSSLTAIWSANDLGSSDPNPPNKFFATQTDELLTLDPSRGAGTAMFDAPDDRGEPFLVEHPRHFAVLAWTDHRKYTLEPQVGGIELYVAPVAADLTTGVPTVFPHARFIAGTSELNGVAAHTNVILTWIDERNGQGILDPKSEVWIETAWY